MTACRRARALARRQDSSRARPRPPPASTERACHPSRAAKDGAKLWLFQIPAESLDAAAGFLQVLGLGRIGNAERRADAERRALHHRDAFGVEQLGDEVLVGAEFLAARRRLAHRAGAGRIDVERAFRPRTLHAARLVEHRDNEVAPLLEDLV